MLAASTIPNCLEHGDLWPGNVFPAVTGQHHSFIDFGDAAWTHPFLSMPPLLRHYQRLASAGASASTPGFQLLVEEYLLAWSGYDEPANLMEAFFAATLIAPPRRSRAAIDNFDHAGIEDAQELGPTPWQWLTSTPAAAP
jgi:hypothetical protein